MELSQLPALNATLNSISTVFIAVGWWSIARERKLTHMICMSCAVVISTLFLISYLTYHLNVESVKFTADGWVRPVYFTILISHIILAFTVPPLVIMSVIPAVRARYDRHRRMGKLTMPIWLYVSVTGVLVYFFLYQWFPPQGLAD
ncbi:MAG: DUF420 domain-containing protein [Verrucomicrobiales bacterium]